MRAAPGAWSLPEISTIGALASGLDLEPSELDWFAAAYGRAGNASPARLRHYTYRWIEKPSGFSRLLECPKRRLRSVQRRVLREILDHIPAHERAHGFRRGRSIRTYATPHTGKEVVLRVDLRNFFPSIPASRVHALFQTIGYPEDVVRMLTGFCTHSVPEYVLSERGPNVPRLTWNARLHYRFLHLPQGAPSSPAIANLCAFRLDCRLASAAKVVGVTYGRYADDLAFSGDRDFASRVDRVHLLVCCVALEEGFEVETRKTRILRRGNRQCLAGVVVNAHPNVERRRYDLLRATLHNCSRHDPASQNRGGHRDFRAHLLGRISHVAYVNPKRKAKLLELFERIYWRE